LQNPRELLSEFIIYYNTDFQ